MKRETLSQISRDIGQVIFASVFIGPIMTGGVDAPIIFAGFFFTFSAWCISFLFAKE